MNPVGGDDTDVPDPWPMRRNKRLHEGPNILRYRRMDLEQHNAGAFKRVLRCSAICHSRPEYVVNDQGKRSGRDRIGLVFVDQVARVGKAGQDVVVCQSWVVRHEMLFRLPRGKQFEDESHGQASPANYGFAGQDFRITDDARGPRHVEMLPHCWVLTPCLNQCLCLDALLNFL